jgi:hypothetical protein
MTDYECGKISSTSCCVLLSALVPAINVDAGNDARTDTDTGYLSEKWRAGLGTGLGALNSIKSADIDADGEDELVFGNSQGYVHVLDWNASAGAFSEEFQSVDMGGAVKGMEIAQIDDDPQLEIAIGYNWNSDSGKVKIIDGISLLAEANWSSGVSWSHTQWTEGWPYGIAMGDLDGDNQTELGMSADRGFLWVVDTNTPRSMLEEISLVMRLNGTWTSGPRPGEIPSKTLGDLHSANLMMMRPWKWPLEASRAG